jgi:hypothetical protein
MEFMTRVRPWALVLVLVLALATAAAGCAQSNEAPTPIPIPLAPATAVDNFAGTLNVLGSNYHQFQLKQPGEVQITLTSTAYAAKTDATTGISSPSTRTDPIPALTILVGTPAATTIGLQCSPLAFNGAAMVVSATAGATPQLKGNALAGNFCISVSDPNSALLDPITYRVTVARPADPQ